MADTKLPSNILEEDYKIAYSFATKLTKEFSRAEVIKTVAMFGSVAKGRPKPESDIDIIVLVDDASVAWDQEGIAWYNAEIKKIAENIAGGDRLHINTVTLTNFWENMLVGEPVIINILRYGYPLVDVGIFEPFKALLMSGRLKLTPEAVYTVMSRVPWHTSRARIKLLGAVSDLYWAMVDSAHAPLIQAGFIPPSPEHVGEMLTKAFVNTNKLDKKYVHWYEEIYELAEKIKHNQITEVPGSMYDKMYERAEEFVKVMTKLLKVEENKSHIKN